MRAVDETIRVRKMPSGPVRQLPQQYAPVRAHRWPWVVVALCFFGGLAIAEPVQLPKAQRSVEADELLRLLPR
jgi:hypothetical protein